MAARTLKTSGCRSKEFGSFQSPLCEVGYCIRGKGAVHLLILDAAALFFRANTVRRKCHWDCNEMERVTR